jgi:hypothetical protein
MDKDFKWLIIGAICFFFVMGTVLTAEKYINHLTIQYAMEHGYIQEYDPSCKILLWVKEK